MNNLRSLSVEYQYRLGSVKMRFPRVRVALAISLLGVMGGIGQGKTVDELEAIVRSGVCQPNMPKYDDVTFKQHCGQNYETEMSNVDAVKCQMETNAINAKISKDNTFRIKCVESYRR